MIKLSATLHAVAKELYGSAFNAWLCYLRWLTVWSVDETSYNSAVGYIEIYICNSNMYKVRTIFDALECRNTPFHIVYYIAFHVFVDSKSLLYSIRSLPTTIMHNSIFSRDMRPCINPIQDRQCHSSIQMCLDMTMYEECSGVHDLISECHPCWPLQRTGSSEAVSVWRRLQIERAFGHVLHGLCDITIIECPIGAADNVCLVAVFVNRVGWLRRCCG